MARTDGIKVPIKADPAPLVATIDVIVKHLTALRDELADLGDGKKGVRYWVLVSRELLDSPYWAQAGLRRIEIGAWENAHQNRWVLFEDPAAPPELDGLEVELTFERLGDGPVRVLDRVPAAWQVPAASSANLQWVAEAGGGDS